MALLRGTARGLLITIGNEAIEESLVELAAAIASGPEFYRGSTAQIAFRAAPPSLADFERFRLALGEYGIDVTSLLGDASVAGLAEAAGLSYSGEAPPIDDLSRRREGRGGRSIDPRTVDRTRPLITDFAGARADFAARRTASVSQLPAGAGTTMFHRGTVRSGQVLRHPGHIVIIGDVNPGAEIVAVGDIVVFGTLRGQAHAGAQGDTTARVTAIELSPTQLRIATCIAAGERATERKKMPVGGEEARIEENRIIVVPVVKGES